MIQTLTRHKLIVIVAALLIAGGVWYGLSATPSGPALITSTPIGSGNVADQGIVAVLLTMRAVKLDGTILNDPSFMSLQDFSTQIVPESVGRENPFAPLSSQASISASSTPGAQIFKPRP